MVDFKALVLAVITHFVFRLSLFINFSHCPSHIREVPSIIILFSVCLFLLDNEIIPKKYDRKGPYVVQVLLEFIICLFLIEISMGLIWSKVELLMDFGFRQIIGKAYESWNNLLVNTIITSIATTFFISTAIMTNNMDKIVFQLQRVKTSILDMFKGRGSCSFPMTCQVAAPGNCRIDGTFIPVAANSFCPEPQVVRPTTATSTNHGDGDVQRRNTTTRTRPMSRQKK